jgi:alpha-L-rhamnosidase
MKNIVILLLLLLPGVLPARRAAAQVRVQHLRCENLTNPLGLDVSRPRFSWQLSAPNGLRAAGGPVAG